MIIKKQFDGFMSHSYPSGKLPPEQFKEIHRAFWSGALVALQTIMCASQTLPESEAETVILAVDKEIMTEIKSMISTIEGRN